MPFLNRLIKITFIVIVLAAATYFSFAGYGLMTIDIENLIVSSLHPETNRFPAGMPEFYMLHFRGNKKDIETLSKGKGLGFILSDTNEPSNKILKYASFFLKKGLDINLIGFDGLTALHSAILQNQPVYVSFLLENGADKNIGVDYSFVFGKKEKTKIFGLNAIELANFISEKDKKDRSQIIKILTEHKKVD